MHADNARSGQLTDSLLLHGVLYNTQRSAHDGQQLRTQGKQHFGYAAAQHRRKKIGKWVHDLLGIKALPAVAMQIHKTGGENIHCKISRTAAGNGSDPTISTVTVLSVRNVRPLKSFFVKIFMAGKFRCR